MKFVTNRISTGKAKSFADIIREYQESKNEVKVASSTETVIKTAEEKDEADSSGQLDVEPLHQEGESTTMPKAGPSAKKEGTDGKAAAAKTDPEKEGEDSGQPKAEGSEKLTNDPKVLEEAKGGSVKGKAKKAALEDLPEEVQEKIKGKGGEEDKEDETKDACGAKHSSTDEEEKEEKEAAGMCPKCKCDPCECEEVEAEAKDDSEEKKEASSVKFVKIANLNAKNKTFLKKYWTNLYGEDYVNALLADK